VGPERAQLFGDRLHVRVETPADAEPLVAALATAGLPAVSVRPVMPTLEDVFIERVTHTRPEERGHSS
jgi:hypothetical protein